MAQSPKRPRNDVSESATTINDLNDDVLREIFRYLSASELHVIAKVCRAFNRNAQAELPSRYKVVDFSHNPWKYDPAKFQFYLQQLAPVLQRFGSSIVSIGVDNGYSPAESSHLIDFLIEYCGKSLKSLRLDFISLTSDMVLRLRPILSQLEVLKLRWCTWELEVLPKQMLSFCSELKEIDIRHNDDVNTAEIVQSLVAHFPHVEKILLCGRGGNASDFIESAKQLKRLTALKSLNIECYHASFTPVLKELAAARVPLECLLLTRIHSNAEFVNEISKWKQLKKLGLASAVDLSLADVLTIVRNLSDLTELSLHHINIIGENDLDKILLCAPKLRKLEWGWWNQWRSRSDSAYPVAVIELGVDWFLRIRDVLANRMEKSPAFLLSLARKFRLKVADDLRKANEDILIIDYITCD